LTKISTGSTSLQTNPFGKKNLLDLKLRKKKEKSQSCTGRPWGEKTWSRFELGKSKASDHEKGFRRGFGGLDLEDRKKAHKGEEKEQKWFPRGLRDGA